MENVDIVAEQQAEDEDGEIDVELYFVFWQVDGLHTAEATPDECQFFTVIATQRNRDLTSRMQTLENISSGGVISDNMR